MPTMKHQRHGAIVPLFAVVAPVLMIFCAMAINLAYVQLSNTEMQIAVDVAVHAGGRRLGTPILNADGSIQTLEEAKQDVMDFAAEIAARNTVAGHPAEIPESIMQFGRSSRNVRSDGTFAPYKFEPIVGNQIPSSFRIVTSGVKLRHVFGPFASSDGFTPSETFNVAASSVSTQVDRDVVLVLDRSGSMISFEDTTLLENTLFDLSQESYTKEGEILYEYRVQFQRLRDNITWTNSRFGPYMTEAEFDVFPNFPSRNEYRLDFSNRQIREQEPDEVLEKITNVEYDETQGGITRRWYSSNVIYWLERTENPDHLLGDEPETWTDGLTVEQQREKLTGHMALYAHDYRYLYKLDDPDIRFNIAIEDRLAPVFSRWYHLDRAVTVFLNVLGGGVDPNGTERNGTAQKEQIAILPFNSAPDTQTVPGRNDAYHDLNSDFDYGLQDDGFPSAFVSNSDDPGYAEPHQGSSVSLRGILSTICPYGGTAIGDSLREAVFIIRSPTDSDTSARARPFAAKTIVVLTDGQNTFGDDPVTVAENQLATEDVLVHTVTFTPGVSQDGRQAMGEVARFGRGKHYHTDTGAALATIFEEIANNLPTIITQ